MEEAGAALQAELRGLRDEIRTRDVQLAALHTQLRRHHERPAMGGVRPQSRLNLRLRGIDQVDARLYRCAIDALKRCGLPRRLVGGECCARIDREELQWERPEER